MGKRNTASERVTAKSAPVVGETIGNGVPDPTIGKIKTESYSFEDAKGKPRTVDIPTEAKNRAWSIFQEGMRDLPEMQAIAKQLEVFKTGIRSVESKMMALVKDIAKLYHDNDAVKSTFEAVCTYAESTAKTEAKAKGNEKPIIRDMLPSWQPAKTAVISFLSLKTTAVPTDLLGNTPNTDREGKVLSTVPTYPTIQSLRTAISKARKGAQSDAANLKAAKVLGGLAATTPKMSAQLARFAKLLNLLTADQIDAVAGEEFDECLTAVALRNPSAAKVLADERAHSAGVKASNDLAKAGGNPEKLAQMVGGSK